MSGEDQKLCRGSRLSDYDLSLPVKFIFLMGISQYHIPEYNAIDSPRFDCSYTLLPAKTLMFNSCALINIHSSINIFVCPVFMVDPYKQKVNRNNGQHESGKYYKGGYHISKYTRTKSNNTVKVSGDFRTMSSIYLHLNM